MTSKSEEFLESIRDSNRKQFQESRKEKRFRVSTVQRSGLEHLQPRSYTPSQIQKLAQDLKKKKGIARAFLAELSQALSQSEQNSIVFGGVDGAVQALCSFLTGGDSSLQLESAYCVANIALWEDDSVTGHSHSASVTGVYLITLLSSGSPIMQEACCWALGNMLPQAKDILFSQGLVKKVTELFKSPAVGVKNAAVQCLSQLVATCQPLLEDLISISNCVLQLLKSGDFDLASVAWILFLLSYHQSCDKILLNENLHVWAFSALRDQLGGPKNVAVIIPLIRCLSNWCAENDLCTKQLLDQRNISSILLQLLDFPYECICRESFLFVCSMVNNSNDEIQSTLGEMQFKVLLENSMSKVCSLF